MTQEKIIEFAQKAVTNIKRNNKNPYKELLFVEQIFKNNLELTNNVKNIIYGTFSGTLNENVFKTTNLPTYKHLYNFLVQENCASKYNEIAEYMNYPKMNEMFNEEFEEYNEPAYEDEGQRFESLLKEIEDKMVNNAEELFFMEKNGNFLFDGFVETTKNGKLFAEILPNGWQFKLIKHYSPKNGDNTYGAIWLLYDDKNELLGSLAISYAEDEAIAADNYFLTFNDPNKNRLVDRVGRRFQ